MTDIPKEVEQALLNWGRHVNDGWLRDNLLYTPPPTSDGYLAPAGELYDPPPTKYPIDELAADETEKTVIKIGLIHFDSYRVLVHWYPKLMMLRTDGVELSRNQALKRLAKHMHCSYPGAERMLDYAVRLFWQLTT